MSRPEAISGPSGSLQVLLQHLEIDLTLRAGRKQTRHVMHVAHRYLWRGEVGSSHHVTRDSIRSYLAGLLDDGKSLKTVWNHRAALIALCEHLPQVHQGQVNPAKAVRLRKLEERIPRWLTDEEVDTTLGMARQLKCWPEVALALSTGLRLSEMIRLEWSDVSLAGKTLRVRRSKSRKPRRVPLSRMAIKALRLQRRRVGKFVQVFPARQTWRGGWGYRDRPRAPNWWWRMMAKIAKEVPSFHDITGVGRGWHLLRHTFASRLAQKGVSLYKLSKWLGHSDVRTTTIYAHLQEAYDEDIEAGEIR